MTIHGLTLSTRTEESVPQENGILGKERRPRRRKRFTVTHVAIVVVDFSSSEVQGGAPEVVVDFPPSALKELT